MNRRIAWRYLGLVAGAIIAASLLITACSTDSYNDPEAQYYRNDNVVGVSLLPAETLTAWDANSGARGDGVFITDAGEKVVLMQCVQEPAHVQSIFVTRGHIPGAIPSIAHLDGLVEARNDGMLVGDHDAPTGATFDQYIQKYGITRDSVIVLTRDSTTNSFCPTRTWWTFHYWGFPRDRVLMLDGDNRAWDAIEGNSLVNTQPVYPSASSFSVAELPRRNFDSRLSTGAMMRMVDENVTSDGREFILLDARQPLRTWANSGGFNFPLTPRPTAFDGIIKGARLLNANTVNPALYTAEGLFKSREELATAFQTIGIDGNKPVYVYCNTGALASLYYYVLNEILGYEVTMYDAGWTEWASMTAWQPTMAAIGYVRNDLQMVNGDSTALVANPTFLQSRFFRWDGEKFVDVLDPELVVNGIVPGGNMLGIPRWDTLIRSDYVAFRPTATVNDPAQRKTYHAPGTTWSGTSLPADVLDQDWPSATTFPSYAGDGDEIRRQDEAYGGQTEAPSQFAPSVGGGC